MIERGPFGGIPGQDSGELIPVPPDPETLRAIAETTGGEFSEARTSDALERAYENLGSRLGREPGESEITWLFLAIGGVLLLLAGGIAAVVSPRFPVDAQPAISVNARSARSSRPAGCIVTTNEPRRAVPYGRVGVVHHGAPDRARSRDPDEPHLEDARFDAPHLHGPAGAVELPREEVVGAREPCPGMFAMPWLGLPVTWRSPRIGPVRAALLRDARALDALPDREGGAAEGEEQRDERDRGSRRDR